MKNKSKKGIIKDLQKEAEQLWKDAVKARDKQCQIKAHYPKLCKGGLILQAHHIFSRKNKGLFFDINTGMLLCRGCHFVVSPPVNSETYKELIRRIAEKDQATYDRLFEQSLMGGAFLEWKDISWLTLQIEILRELKQNA